MLESIFHALFLILAGIWFGFPMMMTMEWYGYLLMAVAIIDAGLVLWKAYKKG